MTKLRATTTYLCGRYYCPKIPDEPVCNRETRILSRKPHATAVQSRKVVTAGQVCTRSVTRENQMDCLAMFVNNVDAGSVRERFDFRSHFGMPLFQKVKQHSHTVPSRDTNARY